MNHDLAWLDYCKTHGMDSMNRNTRSLFMAGAKAEREYCLSILMHLHERAFGMHNYYHYAANVIRDEEVT
jgi:hypothetical protein